MAIVFCLLRVRGNVRPDRYGSDTAPAPKKRIPEFFKATLVTVTKNFHRDSQSEELVKLDASIVHGHGHKFVDVEWRGIYQIDQRCAPPAATENVHFNFLELLKMFE